MMSLTGIATGATIRDPLIATAAEIFASAALLNCLAPIAG